MSSASILTLLPRPVDPVPGDTFDDRALLLFAAVACSNERMDGALTYSRYERTQEGVRTFFGERALDAAMQAKLHYALLHPPGDPVGLARKMSGQAEDVGVTAHDRLHLCQALCLTAQDATPDDTVNDLLRHLQTALRSESLSSSPRPEGLFTSERSRTAKAAAKTRVSDEGGTGKLFESFFRRATGWMLAAPEPEDSPGRCSHSESGGTPGGSGIARAAGSALSGWETPYPEGIPGPHLMAMLDAHAAQLTQSAFASLEQARTVIHTAVKDLDAWDEATERDLLRFHETLSLRLMDAVNRKVIEQERRFAGSSVWKEFDDESRTLATQAIDAFINEQRAVVRHWEEKLQQFAAQMDAFSKECLERLSVSIAELNPRTISAQGDIWTKSDLTSHVLVQLRHHMKIAAIFATGLAVGRLTALGPVALAVSAGSVAAFAFASPFAAAGVVAAAGAAGYLYHLGREDRRKAAFLEKKRREADAYADRICETLRTDLKGIRKTLGDAYSTEIKRNFAPALESLLQQSAHLHLFVEVMKQIKER